MDVLGYFVHRSDRKRYTVRQRRQAAFWAIIAAVIFVTYAMMTVH